MNGFDPLIKRSEEVLKSTSDIAAWFKKLSSMHENHAKSLIKNSSLTNKKKASATEVEIG